MKVKLKLPVPAHKEGAEHQLEFVEMVLDLLEKAALAPDDLEMEWMRHG